MRRPKTDQDRADDLLHEWAGGVFNALGYGYPPAPTPGRVQNSRSGNSAPERFAHDQHRHERLDRAVRRVDEIDPRLAGVLRVHYLQGRDTPLGADEMGMSERTYRRWRKAAQHAFLSEYRAIKRAYDQEVAASVSA